MGKGRRTGRRDRRHRRQPREPGADRAGVRGIQGSWRLEPCDGGRKTLATYTNHLDLGGSVPAALYSLGFVRNAYDVIAKVRSGSEGGAAATGR